MGYIINSIKLVKSVIVVVIPRIIGSKGVGVYSALYMGRWLDILLTVKQR